MIIHIPVTYILNLVDGRDYFELFLNVNVFRMSFMTLTRRIHFELQ